MEAAGVRQALGLLQGHLQDKAHGALCAAIRNLHSQEEQDMASIRTWLRKDQQENELLRQQLKELEEAAELEEAWQQQRQAQRLEEAEARMERALLARRRGFCYRLQALSLLVVGLLLALTLATAAVALCASRRDPELFYRLLPRALPGAAFTDLGYALGRLLPVACAGPLPS